MEKYIDSILKESRVFYPHEEFSRKALIKSMKEYSKIYKKSVENPEAFWAEKANDLEWFGKWNSVLRNDQGFFKWFEGGELNISYNCLDRHVKNGNANKMMKRYFFITLEATTIVGALKFLPLKGKQKNLVKTNICNAMR